MPPPARCKAHACVHADDGEVDGGVDDPTAMDTLYTSGFAPSASTLKVLSMLVQFPYGMILVPAHHTTLLNTQCKGRRKCGAPYLGIFLSSSIVLDASSVVRVLVCVLSCGSDGGCGGRNGAHRAGRTLGFQCIYAKSPGPQWNCNEHFLDK